MSKNGSAADSRLKPKVARQLRRPPMYRVLMLNDDYTTMEFVVGVLERIFRKSPVEANAIMLQIHHQGQGLCGVYPLEIAETKVCRVHEQAREAGFPLRCSLEEA